MAHTPPKRENVRTRPKPGTRHGDRVGGGFVAGIFFTIAGRTDLRIGVSGANFNDEADFEVRLPLAPPKPDENCENRFVDQESFAKELL